jgi:hypothetical protein
VREHADLVLKEFQILGEQTLNAFSVHIKE